MRKEEENEGRRKGRKEGKKKGTYNIVVRKEGGTKGKTKTQREGFVESERKRRKEEEVGRRYFYLHY